MLVNAISRIFFFFFHKGVFEQSSTPPTESSQEMVKTAETKFSRVIHITLVSAIQKKKFYSCDIFTI